MSTKKKNVKNIITPLAAAFLTAEPEEEVAVLAKPQPKKPVARPVVKPAEVKIGELTKEETRALLKEQLVAGVIDDKAMRPEADDEVPFIEEVVEKAPEKKAAPKKESGAKKEKAQVKESKKEPAAKKEAPAKKAEEKKPEVKKPEAKKPETKKAEVKKAETKKPEAKKTEAKKAGEKKPEAAKAEVKKEAGIKEELNIEYAGSSYSKEELMNKALKVWTSVLKRGRNELHTMELYIKPQEKTVYYVFNGRRKGSFDL